MPLTSKLRSVLEPLQCHAAAKVDAYDADLSLNYAIMLQAVVKDFDMAEKFYRRALSEAPDDRLVVRNYEDFEAQRLPGGMYAGGGPSVHILKTSDASGEGVKTALKARLADEFGIQHSTLELEDLEHAHESAQLYGHKESEA